MALFTDDQVIEWLEKLRGMAGPGADMATAALDLLDGWEAAETELTDLSDRLGDFDEAEEALKDYRNIETWSEAGAVIKELAGDSLFERLKSLENMAARYETESFALQELCAAAGLIDRNDFETNPIPLLRMFLPVD